MLLVCALCRFEFALYCVDRFFFSLLRLVQVVLWFRHSPALGSRYGAGILGTLCTNVLCMISSITVRNFPDLWTKFAWGKTCVGRGGCHSVMFGKPGGELDNLGSYRPKTACVITVA